MLDNGDIDYVILDALEQFGKSKSRLITINNDYSRQEFLLFPIIRAMLDLNLLFKSKYYDELSLEHHLYTSFMKDYAEEKLNSMNGYEKMRYKLFKKAKGLKFGSEYSGAPYARELYANKDLFPKKSYIWGDLAFLYFKLQQPDEAFDESFI